MKKIFDRMFRNPIKIYINFSYYEYFLYLKDDGPSTVQEKHTECQRWCEQNCKSSWEIKILNGYSGEYETNDAIYRAIEVTFWRKSDAFLFKMLVK